MGLNDITLDRSYHEYRTPTLIGDVGHATIPARSVSRAMWTCDDTKKALLFSLIPGGVALTAFGALCKDRDILEYWKKCKKPNWAPVDTRIYSAIDLFTMAPLGYATYLVYKNGGIEYSDTRAALGLYGANVAFQLATIPLIKRRDMNLLVWNVGLASLTAAAAAYAYYKIDKTAGLLLVPYALWSGFYTFLARSVYEQNKSDSEKPDSH